MGILNWKGLALAQVAFGAVSLGALTAANAATVNVGINFPLTGPISSFGVPMANEAKILPKQLTDAAGNKWDINYIILDSKSDATQSAENTRKLITENHVDMLWGEAGTPPSLAMVPIAADGKTPMIGTTAATTLVAPINAQTRWVFKTVPNDEVGGKLVTKYMGSKQIKTLGVIGYNDSYMDIWRDIFKAELPQYKITVVDEETFERSATTTVPQALKLISHKPDAIFIAAGGTPADVPTKDLRQRGFKGLIFAGHGIGLQAFIDQGGKDVDGVMTAAELLM